MSDLNRGACLCGGVRFTVSADLRAAVACHCVQCRKQSGHYWVSTNVPRASLVITGEHNLRWYQSSPEIRRGFCAVCGCFLFWDALARDYVSIAMGALDSPTATQVEKHIFVSQKGDYYQITDALPQKPRN